MAVASAQSPETIRKALDKALGPLQRSAATFVDKRACFSCHHNALPVLTLHMARERGIAIDSSLLSKVEEKTFRSGGTLDDVVQAKNLNDPTPNDSLLLMAREAAGAPADEATQVRTWRLASWQREDGHWITSDFRPPHSSSYFTATATAIRALRAYMPPAFAAERDRRIEAARNWLTNNSPASTEDAAFRLMGLIWAKAPKEEIANARRDLLAMQKSDGGWSQLPDYPSDAYSTGESVYALYESGIESPKGIRFLLGNQASDGTWHVHTRMISPAEVSPPYFETGFPYKKDQFISYAGSCWATMALLTAIPAKAAEAPAAPVFDPLTARSEVTSLTIAASYYDNSVEVARLLDAGASPKPEAGSKSHVTPLRLAAMSGDLEIAKLLLTHGADPNLNSPLSEAVTFGHVEVAKALIAAGASTDGVESTGINLLHWATITNRAALIPVLVKAGVPLNATDDNGFTPLMYAATIDFGDTRTLEALLAAGADKTIRDLNKRTPLEQASRFGHARIAGVLRQNR
jgi:hypothetical protein